MALLLLSQRWAGVRCLRLGESDCASPNTRCTNTHTTRHKCQRGLNPRAARHRSAYLVRAAVCCGALCLEPSQQRLATTGSIAEGHHTHRPVGCMRGVVRCSLSKHDGRT